MSDKNKTRIAAINGLHELADFLERHPAVPMPNFDGQNAFVSTREELAIVARVTSWQKLYLDSWFVLVHEFSGGVSLHINTERSKVCRKVTTGTKIIPASPEREVEEYEWICEEPVLAGEAV